VDLDLDRDEKACSECQSNAVKTINDQCSVCEDGTFVAEDTGLIA
jgi:ribosomal protein S27AE